MKKWKYEKIKKFAKVSEKTNSWGKGRTRFLSKLSPCFSLTIMLQNWLLLCETCLFSGLEAVAEKVASCRLELWACPCPLPSAMSHSGGKQDQGSGQLESRPSPALICRGNLGRSISCVIDPEMGVTMSGARNQLLKAHSLTYLVIDAGSSLGTQLGLPARTSSWGFSV